ncbi:hypothetical protein FGG08_002263 [Glutinoglossum americanum]|uniref:Uncharacterized protein n=1 Tax=Glutinoglossum americanum TaxID=1670608 RepID=A0A9P8I9M2_9PEZI|nr:hypothetical protein FGG08_002263 [Glutinoglossum americanum]
MWKAVGSEWIAQAALEPAKQLLVEREAFKRRIQRLLKGVRGNHQICTTEADLHQQLNELGVSLLGEMAARGLQDAGWTHSTYRKERMAGAKKMGRIAQSLTESFANFLKAYSGIIELVRRGGHVYGELAYETISILLIEVVVNKSGNDMKIAGLLEDLHNSFPRLETLVGVYPTARLKECVVLAYKEIILFARGASEYFARFSVRLRMALGKPPSMGIDVTAAAIHSRLAEVNSEAMVLLHHRSKETHENTEKIKTQNKKLQDIAESSKTEIEGLRRLNEILQAELADIKAQSKLKARQQDEERLQSFRNILKIEHPRRETEVDKCRQTLLEAFPNLKTSPRKNAWRFEQMTPELLNEEETYLDWLNSADSCLLILSGITMAEGRLQGGAATYSWLSPATVFIAEKAQSEKRLLAYFCCHPELRAEDHPLAQDVISHLAYQLLVQRPEILRYKYSSFCSIAQERWQSTDPKISVKLMARLLRETLMELEKLGDTKTVYIVLDRLDQCEWTSAAKPKCKIRDVLDELAKLVADENCSVKVAIVTGAMDQQEWDVDHLGEKVSRHVRWKIGWRQKKLRQDVYELRMRNLHLVMDSIGTAISQTEPATTRAVNRQLSCMADGLNPEGAN